ncbi:MFS transporter [Dysgonomonas sp. 511]|uniref:MFS transporter n=1 Tax=Dysgonomonas sp. 511 TaxID=2302930 RepID=UPI0013D30677|nr:MFS transporter [Dysgonomonas sp. 511]NDV77947.1 MFS transporter [Dysgonomonas sp. 511]
MTEILRKKLSDSAAARWTVLCVVAFTMFCGYFVTDVMAPLMEMLGEEFGWSAEEYGIFNLAYGLLNVALFMLIISGIILDKIGVRLTGIGSCILMIIGCFLKYYAVSKSFEGEIFGLRTQVFLASIGFAIFALGIESAGITVTKVIVRWFKGKEMALAMGIQVSVARLGTTLAMSATLPLANYFGSPSRPILFGLAALCIGLIAYLVFCVMDKKLDGTVPEEENSEPFKVKDIGSIISSKGFWLLALLCVLFYSAIFPFLKYAVSFMINKYGVDPNFAGILPSILPIGAIFLTPLFGGIYDAKGKGATIMMIGAILLIFVHFMFSLPILNHWVFAAILMVVLGFAFSLVPSAMWPSVPKIIDENKVGTAYGLIFWVQNIGLSLVPYIIGRVLDNYGIIGTKITEKGNEVPVYDYTYPSIIFTCFGVLALFTAVLLKREDKKKGYGLELPNIKK